MKTRLSWMLTALILIPALGVGLGYPVSAQETNSTVSSLSPMTIPALVEGDSRHLEVYFKVDRIGGYTGTTSESPILESLPAECFELSNISGTALDLSKPIDLSIRFSKAVILLKLNAFVTSGWNNDTQWRIKLLCDRVTPRKYIDGSGNRFDIGDPVLSPFNLTAVWKYPEDPNAQTAAAAAALNSPNFDLRSSYIAGSNRLDHICIGWGLSQDLSSITFFESLFASFPAWLDPYILGNQYASRISCWSSEEFPLSRAARDDSSVFHLKPNGINTNFALIFGVANSWGLKPLLVGSAGSKTTTLNSFAKFGLRQTVDPANPLTSVKVIAKSQKLETTLVWPKNAGKLPVLEAEMVAKDEFGTQIMKRVPYGTKSVQFQLPHGGKWTLNHRTGTSQAWSSLKVTAPALVPGIPLVKKSPGTYENVVEPILKVGHPFKTKLYVTGFPAPKVTAQYFDCGSLEKGEASVLLEGCTAIPAKVATGPVPLSLLDHFVLARVVAKNSFGQDEIYTRTSKVGDFYNGGLSIKIKNKATGSFELVNKGDWGVAKPTITVLEWGVWNIRDDAIPYEPIFGTAGKTSIKFPLKYDESVQQVGAKVRATSKLYGTIEVIAVQTPLK